MREDKSKKFEVVIVWMQFAFAIFAVCLIIYLFLVQVLDIRNYRDRATKQRSTKNYVLRGEILDRNGMKLATTNTTYHIYAHPEYYDYTPDELAQKIAPIIGENPYNLAKRLSNKNTPTILIKKNADRKTVDRIKAMELREISFDVKHERTYPQGAMAAHVLGFYNPDADMSAGVEYSASSILTHIEKIVKIEKTPKGDIIYNIHTDPEDITKPIKGQTLVLTIDTAIQHVCEQELFKMIQKKRALRGAVVVLDPKTGEILAFAVYPNYDPNKYKKASLIELKNWALTDVYPPGSTFKVLTVASAMDLGKINRHSKIEDTGKIKLANYEIKNYDYYKTPYPGYISLQYLFRHSSNVASVRIARMMSVKEFYDELYKFGLGQKTGIDLPGESMGILPNIRTWEISRHGNMGIGYGASVTVIQMAAAVAAIANNGVWITPHVIKYPPGEIDKHVFKRQIILPETAKTVTDILADAIDEEENFLQFKNYRLAAKTGTSLRPKENGLGYTNKMYTSIVGYLPASDPKVLIYVVVDSPEGEAIWGSTVAAPIFKEIATQITRIMNLKPDKKTGE